MKFKIDQNLPVEFAAILAETHHDAVTAYQQDMSGESDEQIVAACHRENRVLVTADLDLSDIRHYSPEQSPGHIILRLKDQSRPNQMAVLRKILPLFATKPLAGHLWIVEEDRVRIRGGQDG